MEKKQYVTLEEMYDILMRDEYKAFREQENIELVTLEDGTRRLSRIMNGYTVERFPLIYRHIEAEEILVRFFNDIDWKDIGYESAAYYYLYELWSHPLVWVDPLEYKDRVIDGRVAKEGSRPNFYWAVGLIIDRLRNNALSEFADNPPLYIAYDRDSLDFLGIHSWRAIISDYSAIEKKIDKVGHFSSDDYKLVKEYVAKCLRENLVIIAKLRGGKRSAELLRMLQAEWPTLKRWKIEMSKMSKEEIEEFEEVLMKGFDDLLEEWEKDKVDEEIVEEGKRFILLTDECRAEGKEGKVISELRTACKGTAVGLWKVIRTNEALDYLGTRGMQTSKIYRAIVDYFGELPYSERNFRDARDKA